jgi:site-specific DNA-methyltransferase (adenine-specific)
MHDRDFQAVIADPPYFQVLEGERWDNQWQSAEEYLRWFESWAELAAQKLRDDGLFFIFGQPGKREHVWVHVVSRLCAKWQFHDMLIWDRAVGYNERYDSFTPCYEMILVLRKSADSKAYFDKDAVRTPYDDATIRLYLRDKRYSDPDARKRHLAKGKYATNILRVPSLKGLSKEKVGHPSQKPIRLIRDLVACSTRKGDAVLDLFSGSGTTAVACQSLGRRCVSIEIHPEYAGVARSRIDSASTTGELFDQSGLTDCDSD